MTICICTFRCTHTHTHYTFVFIHLFYKKRDGVIPMEVARGWSFQVQVQDHTLWSIGDDGKLIVWNLNTFQQDATRTETRRILVTVNISKPFTPAGHHADTATSTVQPIHYDSTFDFCLELSILILAASTWICLWLLDRHSLTLLVLLPLLA